MTKSQNNYTTLDNYQRNQPSQNPFFALIMSTVAEHGGGKLIVASLLRKAIAYERATAHLKYSHLFSLRAQEKIAGISRETLSNWKNGFFEYWKGGEKQ